MTDEVVVTEYYCSACGAKLTNEGTNAFDHMVSSHGANPDPETGPQPDSPYLIPVESNPTDIPGQENPPGE